MTASGRRISIAGLVVMLTAAALAARAQDVLVTPLLRAHDSTRAIVVGDHVFVAQAEGGVTRWLRDDPAESTTWSVDDLLGGHLVSDLAWSGRNLWVATRGGGLTRIADPGSDAPAARLYSTLIADLDVTAVAAGVVAGAERVYYGTADAGVGVINDGVPGDFFTTNMGLPDDRVSSLALVGDEFFVAGPAGVARFADNVFHDASDGLDGIVNRLTTDGQGRALAATSAGLYRWDPGVETWVLVCCDGEAVLDAAADGDDLWVLAAGVVGRLREGAYAPVTGPADPPESAVRERVLAVAGGEVWLAGRIKFGDMRINESGASFAWLSRLRDDAWQQWWREASIVGDADGVAFDILGRAWLGERNGDGLTSWDPEDAAWSHVYQVASAENGQQGLFNAAGGVLSVISDSRGALWFCQYVAGVIRYRPADITGEAADTFELISPANSPLRPSNWNPDGSTVIKLGQHPEGAIFVMTDDVVPDAGIEVLFEPDAWDQAGSWVAPAVGGATVWSAAVQRRDVIWLAVNEVGLVRWDVNGPAPATAPLTWGDLSDDHISAPIATIAGTSADVKQAREIRFDDQGMLWVGGNRLVRLRVTATPADDPADPPVTTAVLVDEYRAKDSAFVEGLLSDSVKSLGLDQNRHLWVMTELGLNRIRLGEEPERIDAWTDVANFLALQQGVVLYTDDVIAPLPGGRYRQLAVSPDGSRVVVGSDRGCAILELVPAEVAPIDPDISRLHLYPNPFPGTSDDGRLRLGGIETDPDRGATASVVIYNVAGQVVYRNPAVEAGGQGFWDGRNRFGDRVASGLYVVKVDYQGRTAVLTLSVVN